MSRSKLISAAVATGLAISGADAAQDLAAQDLDATDPAGIAIDAIGTDRPGTSDSDVPEEVFKAPGDDDIAVIGTPDIGEDVLFIAPADESDMPGGLIDVYLFDGDDHHLNGTDDADFYLAQTIYAGSGGDALSVPGRTGGRLTPRLEPQSGGTAVTVPNGRRQVTPDRTVKKPGRTGPSLKKRRKKK